MARTNIDLDNRLVKEGMRRLKCRTKKELVNLALKALVRKESIKDLLTLQGKIHWEGNLKAWRHGRR
jgi:Arc/MetJ family transcription regulator